MNTPSPKTPVNKPKTPKPNPPTSKPDLLWKDLFTEFHSEATLFFFGKRVHDAIDFTFKPEFLGQELNETFVGNEPNKKITDKIIRYKLKNGKFRYLTRPKSEIGVQKKFDRNCTTKKF